MPGTSGYERVNVYGSCGYEGDVYGTAESERVH